MKLLFMLFLAGLAVYAICEIGGLALSGWDRNEWEEYKRHQEQQRREQEKAKKEKLLTEGYKCPSCGKMAGHLISTGSKVASISVTGLASNKIGKTYKCAACDYMW